MHSAQNTSFVFFKPTRIFSFQAANGSIAVSSATRCQVPFAPKPRSERWPIAGGTLPLITLATRQAGGPHKFLEHDQTTNMLLVPTFSFLLSAKYLMGALFGPRVRARARRSKRSARKLEFRRRGPVCGKKTRHLADAATSLSTILFFFREQYACCTHAYLSRKGRETIALCVTFSWRNFYGLATVYAPEGNLMGSRKQAVPTSAPSERSNGVELMVRCLLAVRGRAGLSVPCPF